MADLLMRNFKFEVGIAGISTSIQFQSVTGLEKTIEEIEYREGSDKLVVRKYPGQASISNVTFERGFSSDSDLIDWINASYNPDIAANAPAVQNAPSPMRDVNIKIKDRNNIIQREIVLKDCFVVSRQIGDLDATGNDILLETLEVACSDMIERKYSAEGSTR
jgi:phage tail-like protein